MNIKKSWSEVTLKEYRELSSIIRDKQISVDIERAAILTNTDSDTIRNLDIQTFQTIIGGLDWILEQPNSDLELTFELNGVEYGFIPNLDFITTGEYADIENWKDDSIENIHLICALIYRPVVSKMDDGDYTIENHTSQGFMKRANLFLNELPITKVFGAILFFSASGIQFIEILEDYLEATNLI